MLAQALMETEVSGQIGAAPYERSCERIAYRNGYRTRRWDTRVGTIELKIPRSRPAPTSARCLSPAGGPRRHWMSILGVAIVPPHPTLLSLRMAVAFYVTGISTPPGTDSCGSDRARRSRPLGIPRTQ